MKLWLKILVSLGFFGLLLFLVPWRQVIEAITNISPLVWLAALSGFVGGHFLGVLKWRMILNSGRSNLRLVDGIRCYAAGLFANLCLPSIVGGDVLRAALAGKTTGRPEAAIFGGIVDRTIDIAGLGMLVVVGFILSGTALPEWGSRYHLIVVGLGVIGGTIAFVLAIRRPLRRWPRRVRKSIGRTLVAIRSLRRSPRVAITALALSLFIQSGFVGLNAWIGTSIGITLPLAVWFFAWPLAKFVGLLPVSLGGLGVRDASFASILIPFGIVATQGLAVSLVWDSILIGGGLIGGLIWWILRRSAEHPKSHIAATSSPGSHG